MEKMAPAGPVYQAGTLSGKSARDDGGDRDAPGDRAAAALRRARAQGRAARGRHARRRSRTRASRTASCYDARRLALDALLRARGRSTTSPSVKRSDTAALRRFFHAMRERGVFLPPAQFEAWFVSTAHTDADLRQDGARRRGRALGGVAGISAGPRAFGPFRDRDLCRVKAMSTSAPAGKQWFGHPRGLSTLFFTEMWERFSYYGMRGMLVLFLVASVQTGGFGMTDQAARRDLRPLYRLRLSVGAAREAGSPTGFWASGARSSSAGASSRPATSRMAIPSRRDLLPRSLPDRHRNGTAQAERQRDGRRSLSRGRRAARRGILDLLRGDQHRRLSRADRLRIPRRACQLAPRLRRRRIGMVWA